MNQIPLGEAILSMTAATLTMYLSQSPLIPDKDTIMSPVVYFSSEHMEAYWTWYRTIWLLEHNRHHLISPPNPEMCTFIPVFTTRFPWYKPLSPHVSFNAIPLILPTSF